MFYIELHKNSCFTRRNATYCSSSPFFLARNFVTGTKHIAKAAHARPFRVQSFCATSCTTFSSTRNLLKFSRLSFCAFATKTIHINSFNHFVKSECLLHRHKFRKTFIALRDLSSCAFRAKTKIVLFRFRLCMQSRRKRFLNVDGNLTSSIMGKTTCVQKKRAGVSFPADHRLNFSATTSAAPTLGLSSR